MKSARDHNAHGTLTTDLKVRVDRIADEGFDLDEVLTRDWVDRSLGDGSPFHARVDGHITAHLIKVETVVQVRGRARIEVEGECVRCLEKTSLSLDLPLDLALFPKGDEPPATPEGELTADDMGVGTYSEGIIDLSDVVHDEVFLELPMNPVCRESCAGLCPTCGQNLNEGKCSCAPEVDPRLQALRSLKVD